MTDQDEKTIEGNCLIAEFMGLTRKEANATYNKAQYYKPDPKDARKTGSFINYFDSLEYHKSWDKLMPIIATLNTLYAEDAFYGFDHDIYLSMRNWVSDVVIENAFGDAVTMIKWYNKNVKS